MTDDGGIGRLKRRMEAIPRQVREAVQPALLKQAEEVAATMRRFAPVDTGNLQASITVTPGGKSTPDYSQPGGSMVVASNAVAITVGDTNVRYSHLVEYGHNNGIHGGPVPAHPFFWPAVRLHNKKAKKAIKAAIGRAVRKGWGK